MGKTNGFGIGELGRTPESDSMAELKASRLQPRQPARMVKCQGCGEMIPSILAMSSSNGRCCPDCYDDMSD